MAVCVLGSINIDILLSVDALPRPGETVLAREPARMPGGKGANQAVAAARMGANTAMYGAVGGDEGGRWMLAMLGEAGVDVTSVHTLAGEATGTAYIAVDAEAENQIIVVAGANAGLSPKLIAEAMRAGVLLAQLEIPIDTIAQAFAGRRGLRMLNAAPAIGAARALFGDVDVLIVNQHELAFYLGIPAIDGPDDALAARALLVRDDQLVIVTMGSQGAVAVWRDRAFHAPAVPVNPIDTVGAGDCFCGALAALLDEGVAVEAALPLANAAAALCTQVRGAVPAMPVRADAEAFLAVRPTEYARAIKNA